MTRAPWVGIDILRSSSSRVIETPQLRRAEKNSRFSKIMLADDFLQAYRPRPSPSRRFSEKKQSDESPRHKIELPTAPARTPRHGYVRSGEPTLLCRRRLFSRLIALSTGDRSPRSPEATRTPS